MKFVVDIDSDLFETMFKHRLVEDYKLIVSNINDLENGRVARGLDDYQIEDLVDYRSDKFCFEHLLYYYFGTNWRSEINNIPDNVIS
jgi:hypothetical protein